MNDQPLIERIVSEISRRLPAGVDQMREEVEQNARVVLREAISRLDLITREEFDIQRQVLERTRERLEALEKTVTDLEQQASPRS
jgi:hypothetical protein